jgi:hypothetical protein
MPLTVNYKTEDDVPWDWSTDERPIITFVAPDKGWSGIWRAVTPGNRHRYVLF